MKLLKENPDELMFNGKVLVRDNSDAYTFGYYELQHYSKDFEVDKKKEIFLIDNVGSHGELISDYLRKNPEWQSVDWLKNSADITGRFWLKNKVVSIWPPNFNKNQKIKKAALYKLIKDIYLKTKIKITDDWNIEVENNKFKTIGKFLGRFFISIWVTPMWFSIIFLEKVNDKNFNLKIKT